VRLRVWEDDRRGEGESVLCLLKRISESWVYLALRGVFYLVNLLGLWPYFSLVKTGDARWLLFLVVWVVLQVLMLDKLEKEDDARG